MRVVPRMRAASAPTEDREGRDRADVKLMVSDSSIEHTRFDSIVDHVNPGDLLVVNTSPTMPAAIAAATEAGPVVVHVSMPVASGSWIVELRLPSQAGPLLTAQRDEVVHLDGDRWIRLAASADVVGRADGVRLWRTTPLAFDLRRHLNTFGAPIRYDYVPHPWPLARYQTVFTRPTKEFGSAEMASAARPFTPRIVAELSRRGVRIAPIRLHAGVGSLETGEVPGPERYLVSERTAKTIRETKQRNGRVIAVGTTVTRALETAARDGTRLEGSSGWTDLILDSTSPARIVNGILTGWHPPEASHLSLLEAVVGSLQVARTYAAAEGHDYLLHEFGDACLLFAPE